MAKIEKIRDFISNNAAQTDALVKDVLSMLDDYGYIVSHGNYANRVHLKKKDDLNEFCLHLMAQNSKLYVSERGTSNGSCNDFKDSKAFFETLDATGSYIFNIDRRSVEITRKNIGRILNYILEEY